MCPSLTARVNYWRKFDSTWANYNWHRLLHCMGLLLLALRVARGMSAILSLSDHSGHCAELMPNGSVEIVQVLVLLEVLATHQFGRDVPYNGRLSDA